MSDRGVIVSLFMDTLNIEILNQFHRPCRSLSILRRATIRKFQSPLTLIWPWIWVEVKRRFIDFYPHAKFHQHCSIHVWVSRPYILLIWPNSLNSVSRYRAPRNRNFRLRLTPRRIPLTHSMKSPDTLDTVAGYRSCLGPYFMKSGSQWPWPWIWEKFYGRASLIDLYPHTKFHQDQTKRN